MESGPPDTAQSTVGPGRRERRSGPAGQRVVRQPPVQCRRDAATTARPSGQPATGSAGAGAIRWIQLDRAGGSHRGQAGGTGPSQTRSSRAVPPWASTAAMNASPCAYWASLASSPTRLLEDQSSRSRTRCADGQRMTRAKRSAPSTMPCPGPTHGYVAVPLQEAHQAGDPIQDGCCCSGDDDGRLVRHPRHLSDRPDPRTAAGPPGTEGCGGQVDQRFGPRCRPCRCPIRPGSR